MFDRPQHGLAAVAWFQDKLVPNPPEGMFQTLFPDLGLDILRLRNRFHRRGKHEDNDSAQDVAIVKRATAARGRPPRILMSSWSPPAELKVSQAEDHNDDRFVLPGRSVATVVFHGKS